MRSCGRLGARGLAGAQRARMRRTTCALSVLSRSCWSSFRRNCSSSSSSPRSPSGATDGPGDPPGAPQGPPGTEGAPKASDLEVDVSSLFRRRSGDVFVHSEHTEGIEELLKTSIAMRGPISVAQFMKDVLTHPQYGYYNRPHVIGRKGDFTTSPEISHMFGELIGVWIKGVWEKCGKPKRMRVVEIGGGKGTLMSDALTPLKSISQHIQLNLVDNSERLLRAQADALGVGEGGRTGCGVDVRTWNSVSDMCAHGSAEGSPVVFIAHELFDALPVHVLRRRGGEWREVMVEVRGGRFAWTLSPQRTPVSSAYECMREGQVSAEGQTAEVSPGSITLMRQMAQQVSECGGGALVVDYGNDYEMSNTIKAIYRHEFVDIFHRVGECDLSAMVNFRLLRWAVKDHKDIVCAPLMTQKAFLTRCGLHVRMCSLLSALEDDNDAQRLISQFHRLTDAHQMGNVYKCFIMSNANTPLFPF